MTRAWWSRVWRRLVGRDAGRWVAPDYRRPEPRTRFDSRVSL